MTRQEIQREETEKLKGSHHPDKRIASKVSGKDSGKRTTRKEGKVLRRTKRWFPYLEQLGKHAEGVFEKKKKKGPDAKGRPSPLEESPPL